VLRRRRRPDDERRARDAARRAHREAYDRDAAPVLAALRENGLAIDHLPHLHSGEAGDYTAQIAVLIEWLPRVSNPTVKETIARALTVRAGRTAAVPALLQALADAPADAALLRDALGNAIGFTAGPEHFDTVAALVRDPATGDARGSMVDYFARHKRLREPSIAVLRELLADDDTGRYALAPLGRLRAAAARPEIERFLHHEQDWVRNDARRALAKLSGSGR
jgi:hypothetical protein